MPRKTRRRDLAFFLRQLERTGNITLAAECAGLAKSGIHKRKRRDPEFSKACDAAVAAYRSAPAFAGEGDRSAQLSGGGVRHAQAVRRTAGHGDDARDGPLTTPGTTSGLKTAGGSHNQLVPSRYAGVPQLRRLPAGRLTGLGVTNFFAALANTGNVRLAARAVGVAHSSVLARRRTDPEFARQFEAALGLARANVECAIIQAADRTFDPDWADGVDPDGPKMTVGQAIRFLQVWRRWEG